MERISILALAAGRSMRWGSGQKLLQPVFAQSLLDIAIGNLAGQQASQLLFVTGYQAELVEARLIERGLKFVRNENYSSGLLSSIQAGLMAVSETSDGALIYLCDLPRLEPEHVQRILTEASARPEKLIAPVFAGSQGHPSYIPQRFFARILALTPRDSGCRFLFVENPDECVMVPFATDAILKDIDRPEDLEAVR